MTDNKPTDPVDPDLWELLAQYRQAITAFWLVNWPIALIGAMMGALVALTLWNERGGLGTLAYEDQ